MWAAGRIVAAGLGAKRRETQTHVWAVDSAAGSDPVKTCVVHIEETDEQKCSRRFTVATVPIATGDASTAGPASVPKRGQYAGAEWIGSGQAPAH